MTAAELASFRTLLQAQTTPPPRPDVSLFARMRARLTVVERGEPGSDAPHGAASASPPLRLASPSWEGLDAGTVDPPPGTPPVFGRRETEAQHVPAEPEPALTTALAAVRLRLGAHIEETHATPDEPPPPARLAAPAASSGAIAGWSRSRPAGARRRLLLRLDAVLAAELQGLDARIAADAAAG